MKQISPTSRTFTVLLGVFAGLPALSIDLSAPTLAILPATLATSVSVAGLSLSLFMIGFAIGQFMGGRASDRSGRRPVLLIALGVYAFAGVCCSFATSGTQLAIARLVQGGGAGGCSVQAFAIVQDLFHGNLARKKQSYVTVVLAVMPMVAPALGAILLGVWGWRSVHAVLAMAGILLATVVWLLVVESRSAEATNSLRGTALRDARQVLSKGVFRRLAIINGLSYGAVFAYIAGGPIVIMNQFGYSNYVYAMVFASTALALSAGAFANARWTRRYITSDWLLRPFLASQAAAALMMMAIASATVTATRAWVFLPPLILFCFSRGVVSPNLVHLAVSIHRNQAGLASAMVGLAQLLLGAVASAVVAALLPGFGNVGVIAVMAVLSCSAAVIWTSLPTGSVVQSGA